MGTLLQDLRYGLRMALKSPGFTLLAVLTLGVGIAANTTVFSWIDTVLVRPIPGASDGRALVSFETRTANGEFVPNSYPDYRDYRDHLKLLAGLAVSRPNELSLGEGDHSERIFGELVSGNFFAVLGIRPAVGRVFSPEEYGDKQGAYPMAVIGYQLWKSKFAGDPNIAGRQIVVNRLPLTIVGVAPRQFRGSVPGLALQIWIPVTMAAQLKVMPDWMLGDRQTRNLYGIARLKPGVGIGQARAEVTSLGQAMSKLDADTNAGVAGTLLPIWKGHFGAQALLPLLVILMGVCGLVLLIVCANVANLQLARATARHREFSVRLALGAGRGRLIRQLLSESLVLAGLGALAAVPLAMWMRQSLLALLPTSGLPIAVELGLNRDILAFLILTCVLASVAAGIAPAWHVSRAELSKGMQEGGRSGTSGSHSQRLRGVLVVAEIALALVTIIATGLAARSFQIAREIDPGFDPRHVLVAPVVLSTAGYSADQRKQFCERLRARVESEPGIAAVTYADTVPLSFNGGSWEDLRIEGYVPAIAENMKLFRNVVAPGYFGLLRIPLREGRDFNGQDVESSLPAMIVNETFARRFFGGREAIGRKVHGWGRWFTIVGIAADSKYHRPSESATPFFYVPFRQVYRADLDIVFYVRTLADPEQALAPVRRAIQSIDPNVGLFDAAPMAEYIGASLYPQKVAASLLGFLGAIALVLAAVGLYGVMAYSISQRTREIGIRMALGAQAADVLGLMVRQGMVLTLSGLLVGVAVSLVVSRVVAGLLVRVSARDPMVFAGAVLFLGAVALAASYLPARRATRIDPNIALRYQ